MTDWADEQAKEFLDGLEYDDLDWINGPGAPWQRLSTALRKARADGAREFAMAVLHGDDVHRAWLIEAAECFTNGRPLPPARDRANAIEKGTA